VKKQTNSYQVINNIKKAVDYSLNKANQDDLILITGSSYTVQDAKEILVGQTKNICPHQQGGKQ
jgi:folylpolyglutamate synthase/dihydropteroate synthase